MPADLPLRVLQRRRAMRLAHWNAAVWAIGNGLASTQLVVYLALEFKAPEIGLGIGVLLAAPHLLGLLRLGAPALIGRLAARKPFCLICYLLSALVLGGLPWFALPARMASPRESLAGLIALWCGYQLLEYLGTVALWSWLADLVPLRIRGRFIGRRERWMALGQAAGMLATGLFVWGWQENWPGLPRVVAYAIPAALGAGYMLAALVPLVRMPHVFGRQSRASSGLRELLAPLAYPPFLALLFCNCWLSTCNGLIQSPQNVYPSQILKLSLLVMLALKVALRVGQWTVGPSVGRLADRTGNRPVLIASLLVIAQGPMFYFLATPERPWWIAGAWVCWIAWVGLNVGLPNLMLKIAPRESATPYIATWFAAAGLCHGLSTILGGRLFDQFHNRTFYWAGHTLDYYQLAFLLGSAGGCLGAILMIVLVQEPKRNDRHF